MKQKNIDNSCMSLSQTSHVKAFDLTSTPPLEHHLAKSIKIPMFNCKNIDVPNRSRSSTVSSLSSEKSQHDFLENTRESLRNKIELFGHTHEEVAECYNQIGTYYFRNGDFEASFVSFSDALRCLELLIMKNEEKNAGCNTIDIKTDSSHLRGPISKTLVNIGISCWRTWNLDYSIDCLQRALKIQRQGHMSKKAKNNPELASIWYKIGITRSLREQDVLAMEAYNEALLIWKKSCGPVNADVARTFDAQGKIHLRHGNLDDAMRCHSKALKIKKQLVGEHHSSVIISMTNCATVYKRRKEYEKAMNIYKRIVHIQIDISRTKPSEGISSIKIGNILWKIYNLAHAVDNTSVALLQMENMLKKCQDAGLSENDLMFSKLVCTMRG